MSDPNSENTWNGLPLLFFERPDEWADWLERNHAVSRGVWLKIAKKASGIRSITRDEALDWALCYGWIDGQGKRYDDSWWLQKFTPRTPRSTWSKINREKVQALIERGQMQPAGLREIERAKQDGRWDAAYDSPRTATPPPDLQAALDSHPEAAAFFATLDSRNRYAILFRIQTAKKPETRARRIEQFIQMLQRREKLYP